MGEYMEGVIKMREIEFCGCSVRDNKWYYGDLTQDRDLKKYYIEGYNYYSGETGLEREPFCEEVYPQSVGEYIGHHDKNGNKIYDGDIVNIKIYNIDYIATVEYIFPECGFAYCIAIDGDRFYPEEFECDDVEVIDKVFEKRS